METTINITDYLSQEEIKSIVADQLRESIKAMFKSESDAQRLLSNLSYQIVFDEIDKVIPNSRELVIEKTTSILKDIKSYQVFRDASYGGKTSLAYDILTNTVRNNVALIDQKVKEKITNHDYSDEIWSRYENLAESFISNIYEIVRLGREGKA